MKLAEFNRAINPTDEACYIIETPTDKVEHLKFKDIKSILLTRNDVALKMHIPKGLLIIELKNTAIIDAIKNRKEKLLVAKKDDKYYIYAKSSFNKNTINNLLACGVNANTLAYTKKGTEILLPFHSKENVLQKYSKTTIVYSNGIDELPMWLTPLRRASSNANDELVIPIRENASSILVGHVTHVAGFTREQQKELLKIMNANLVVPPLDPQTVTNLCDSFADSLLYEFMYKNEFLHDKFGDYVIEACHIKKDKDSGKLYFYDDKHKIYTDDPDFLRGFITKLCPRLKQYQKDEAIKYISDILETDSVKFNANPFNIVFKNGILHLEDMEFEEMSPDQLESVQLNVNYDPNAKCQTADDFFYNVTCGDEATQQLLYESIGYAMLKTVELAKSFMLTGTGRNGKSTFFDVIAAILGEDNVTHLSPNDLTNNFRSSTLVGKLASLAADISAKPLSETDMLKSIAAGDRIMIEKKYEQAYEGRVYSTLFFACNKLPKTPDTSDGFYRRWVIIPFNANLTKVKNVEGFLFKKRLLSQESLDYIAYNAVQAIRKLFATTQEFTEPQSVVLMKEAYKINNSSVLSWFKENFVHNKTNPTDKEREVGIKDLEYLKLTTAYINYTEWCKETNKQALARPNFEEEVKNQFGVSWDDEH